MVETQEELSWAKREGFTYFQGYFFARPVPALAIPIEIDRIKRSARDFAQRTGGVKSPRLVAS